MSFFKYCFALFFVLFSAEVLVAQTAGSEVDALNAYVNYTNEAVHSMAVMYHSLEKFNGELNDFIEKRTKNVNFDYKNSASIKSSYLLPPEKMLEKSRKKSATLPAATAAKIDLHADAMLQQINALQLYADTINEYCKRKSYLADIDLRQAIALLHNSQQCYNTFDTHKKQLQTLVATAHEAYKYSDSRNAFIVITTNMLPIIAKGEDVLRAVKAGNIDLADSEHDVLFNQISLFIDKRDVLMKPFVGKSLRTGLDPESLFDNFVTEANEFYKASQAYLSSKYSSKHFKGRDYDFYNNYLLQYYNRYGGGLIHVYNQMAMQADVPVLQAIEQLNWFKAVPEEVVLSKADIDSAAIVAEAAKEEIKRAEEAKIEAEKKAEKERKEAERIARIAEREKLKKEKDLAEKSTTKTTAIATETDVLRDSTSLKGFADNNLILLLDVSSSMAQPEKLPLLKDAFKHLLTLMRPTDYVSIIVYSGHARVVLPPTSASQTDAIEVVIDGLRSAGQTNINRGMKLSYQTAVASFIEGGNNRVILASDGGFAIDGSVERSVQRFANQGIVFSVFYLSKTENDGLAEKFAALAQRGQGNYFHVTPDNAKTVLLKEAQAFKKQ